MAELRQNTWETDSWYAQNVAGNVEYEGSANLWMWGSNNQGQLALNEGGNPTNRSSPVEIGASDWSTDYTRRKMISSGQGTTRAVKTDGTLWAWGNNNYGYLGLNQPNNSQRSSPTQVGTDSDWLSVASGTGSNNWAIKTDGTMWWTGYADDNGSSGFNSISASFSRSSPTQMPGSWATVSESTGVTLAVKTDGSLWAWGYNYYGTLGQNTNRYPAFRSSPVQVGTDTDWRKTDGSVSSWGGSFAIKADGTLWSFGTNQYGGLGHNNTQNYSSPNQVGTDTNWKTAFARDDYSYAIKTDGTIWAWGRGTEGYLAQGPNKNHYSSPKQIGTDTDWAELAADRAEIVATKTDGTLWTWGINQNGCLGQNQPSPTVYSSPKQLGTGTNWKIYPGQMWHYGLAIESK